LRTAILTSCGRLLGASFGTSVGKKEFKNHAIQLTLFINDKEYFCPAKGKYSENYSHINFSASTAKMLN